MNLSKQPIPPIFETFLRTCRQECQLLVDAFAFVPGEPAQSGHECSLVYRKPPNVALTFLCEAGFVPTVMVTLPKSGGHDGRRSFDVALGSLVKRKRPGWKPPTSAEATEKHIADAVREYLRALTEDLPEILEANDDVGARINQLLGRKK